MSGERCDGGGTGAPVNEAPITLFGAGRHGNRRAAV